MQVPASHRPFISWAEWHYHRSRTQRAGSFKTSGFECQPSYWEAWETVEWDKLAFLHPCDTVKRQRPFVSWLNRVVLSQNWGEWSRIL